MGGGSVPTGVMTKLTVSMPRVYPRCLWQIASEIQSAVSTQASRAARAGSDATSIRSSGAWTPPPRGPKPSRVQPAGSDALFLRWVADPVLLLAPFAGTLVDRLPRVTVMVAADLLRAVLAIMLIFAAGNVAAVYAIAFGLSVGAVLFKPAGNSALPALVRDTELIAANSGIWTAAVLSQIASQRGASNDVDLRSLRGSRRALAAQGHLRRRRANPPALPRRARPTTERASGGAGCSRSVTCWPSRRGG
jgi:hypothetical protein